MKELLVFLQARWRGAARREQRMLLALLAALLATLLWWLGLAPALAILETADARHQRLDTQIQEMRRLQAQAKTLQAQPQLGADDARRLLDASVKQQLGTTAHLVMVGEQVRLTFKGVPAEALAQWLAQARLNARAVPVEAHLMHTEAGTWDGKLMLSLGAH